MRSVRFSEIFKPRLPSRLILAINLFTMAAEHGGLIYAIECLGKIQKTFGLGFPIFVHTHALHRHGCLCILLIHIQVSALLTFM